MCEVMGHVLIDLRGNPFTVYILNKPLHCNLNVLQLDGQLHLNKADKRIGLGLKRSKYGSETQDLTQNGPFQHSNPPGFRSQIYNKRIHMGSNSQPTTE